MSWDFFPSVEVAMDNANSWASKKDKRYFRKKKITCFLLGREVNAWHTNVITKDGHRYSGLYIWGEVDGKGVLVTLISHGDLNTNNDILPVYRQVVRLAR